MIILLLLLAMSGCASGDSDHAGRIQALEQRIVELEQYAAELERTAAADKEMHQAYPAISHLALDFVRGRTGGDIGLLKSVVSEDIVITEEDRALYGAYSYADQRVRYPLFTEERQSLFQDMLIYGFGYDESSQVYVLHIQEFYIEPSGEPASPPVIMHLYFKMTEDGYRITQFEFDA